VRSAPKKLIWTTYEARLVQTPFRYAVRELLRPTLADYSLRHTTGRISLRHQSGDIDIFRKFYAYGYYDWPPEVMARLKRVDRPINVLDLGANIGLFQVHARADFPIERAVGFEPDPANAEVLERVLTANGGNWEIVRACAANRDGVAMFKAGADNFSRIENEGASVVPTVDVFPYIAEADLVKMNIEGSEWEILGDPRLERTSAVWIVEYHRIRNPEPDITSLARRSFERCGYTTLSAIAHAGNGLLWAWKDDAG
jgi:FkbM family methyltransferase